MTATALTVSVPPDDKGDGPTPLAGGVGTPTRDKQTGWFHLSHVPIEEVKP